MVDDVVDIPLRKPHAESVEAPPHFMAIDHAVAIAVERAESLVQVHVVLAELLLQVVNDSAGQRVLPWPAAGGRVGR